MGTRDRGDRFELLVYRRLKRELAAGHLGLQPRSARLFRRKGYHSRDRDRSIITDLSIEVFSVGRDRPSIVWVFECKDYSGSVPVDDLEEFHSKLEQIGQDNTKGTFVASMALQRSALAYARSKGIGVIRVMRVGRSTHLNYVLESASGLSDRAVDPAASEIALTDPVYAASSDIASEHNSRFFSNWRDLIAHAVSIHECS